MLKQQLEIFEIIALSLIYLQLRLKPGKSSSVHSPNSGSSFVELYTVDKYDTGSGMWKKECTVRICLF